MWIVGWLFAVMACSDAPDPREDAAPDAQPDVSLPLDRTSNVTCFAVPPPPPPGRLRVTRAFTHALDEAGPLKLTHLVQSTADETRWYATQLPGQVLSFSSDPAVPGVTVALDLSDSIDFRHHENGLVSIALHPDFAVNGFAFVVYTALYTSEDFASRISRFQLREDGTFDRASELVVLDVPQNGFTHHGNHVAFDRDGMLLYGQGDDDFELDHRNAQQLTNFFGKVLRLDVDRPDMERGTAYSIPRDNPRIPGALPEIYAYGLRNPWRFNVTDQGTFLVDVGEARREELNLLLPGANYGWPFREGSECYDEGPCEGDYEDPIVEITHNTARAFTLGYPYRRDDIPGLEGRVLLADFVLGKVWSAAPEGGPVELEAEAGFGIASVAEAEDGTQYLVRYTTSGPYGGVYRVEPNPSVPTAFPQRLSETGCVDPEDPRTPAPGLVAYRPIAELWSSGADKERYLAIPDGARIHVESNGDFTMPVGTVLMKSFGFGDRLHETRLLMRTEEGWNGYSYAWNEAQTDAELLPSARSEELPNGVAWEYPSRGECMTCHTEVAGRSLGLEVAQLQHARGDGPTQLEMLAELELLDRTEESAALLDPFGDGDLATRARSYLHANCAMCHQPGGVARTTIDLRFPSGFSQTMLCGLPPRAGRVAEVPGAQSLLVPGEPDRSILWMRMARRGFYHMPPIASDIPDDAAVALIGQWIEDIEACPPVRGRPRL